VSKRLVNVFPDALDVATAVAARLETVIECDLAARGECHIVLTGGTVGIAVLRHVATTHTIDWRDVHVWWGDERFVASDSEDRNDGQAWDAFLARIDIPEENIHRMASTQSSDSVEAAAESYAADLAEFFGADFPHFDVVLLGVGPDAHVASLFPNLPGVREIGKTVIAVRDSPKPPPERVSLSLPSINAARRVWVVAAGHDKAAAIKTAFTPSNSGETPVSSVHGIDETVFFVDETARS
jgi:6-phosphogluconolactonase